MPASGRRLILLLAAAVFLTVSARANPAGSSPLGKSPQEIAAHYGPVLVHNARVRHQLVITGGSAMDGDLHNKNGLIIRVVYHQNHAVLLEFVRASGSLSPADVTTLLASCADDSTWEMGKDSTDAAKLYHRTDGKAVAHWAVDESSLIVASEGDKANNDLMDRLSQ